jgi:hypothetical protein
MDSQEERTFQKYELKKKGLNFCKEYLKNNQHIKEISFWCKLFFIKKKKGNEIKDKDCKILNEIILENEKIEKLCLGGKKFKNKKRKCNNIKRIKFIETIFNKNAFFKRNLFLS